jgi:hypothetical protein
LEALGAGGGEAVAVGEDQPGVAADAGEGLLISRRKLAAMRPEPKRE